MRTFKISAVVTFDECLSEEYYEDLDCYDRYILDPEFYEFLRKYARMELEFATAKRFIKIVNSAEKLEWKAWEASVTS